jgi:anaerobic selenocysteine-containing dehydrogenase
MALTMLQTACPLDCPDGCSLTVGVENGRLVSVDATPVDQAANALTAGFICKKVKHHAERVYGDDRILSPLVRTGPKGSATFRQASWDEALGLVAERMKASIKANGPGSVLPYLYNSSAGVLSGDSLGTRFGAELGLPELAHTICAATMGAAKRAVFGGLLSADPLDIEHAKYIVVWGANPTVSNTHLPPLINKAVREGGAKLVVIDPRRTGIAARAHRHFALRPGTDVVLAAAVARHLQGHELLDLAFISAHSSGVDEFLEACAPWTLDRAAEVTGLDAVDIANFAEEWAAAKPAMLRIGWGMERNHNGGSGITTALALPVLMGHFGQRGSGILHSTGSGNAVDTSALTNAQSPAGASTSGRRTVSQNDLGEVLRPEAGSDRIDVLLVQGANPALMNLDQTTVLAGLAREDLFTVVHEQVMTDTCLYADVVLPATTHFEAPDLVDAYGAFLVQAFPAVIDRVGESRTNAEFFAALGKHFDLDLDADPVTMLDQVQTPRPIGETRAAGTTVQMVDTFPTHADGKFHLLPPVYLAATANLEYPLTLLSPANNKTINSMFGERRAEAPLVHLNTADASARGIVDGQQVSLFNDLASLELTAHVGDDVRPGVVVVAKGFWSRSFGRSDGLALNALIARRVEPLAGGACFFDVPVQVRANP